MDELSYDSSKAKQNELLRGLHFDLVYAFSWETAWIIEDNRRDYGEQRFRAIGLIHRRLHVVIFTPRAHRLHIISLRKANEREIRLFSQQSAR